MIGVIPAGRRIAAVELAGTFPVGPSPSLPYTPPSCTGIRDSQGTPAWHRPQA